MDGYCMKISENDLRNYMSTNDYMRGRAYYRTGRVVQCLIQKESDKELVLCGLVRGSNYRNYAQSVKIINSNRVHISGNCSCSVGHNCKHVVAVCVQYIQKHSAGSSLVSFKQPSLLDSWLDDIQKDVEAEESVDKSDEYFITYRLFNLERNRDELKFYKSKILKNGKISQGTHLNSENFAGTWSFKDIKTEADDDIALLAKNIDFDRWSDSSMQFKGRFGAVLLLDILKTNRAYYDESKIALTYNGEIFKPKLEFKKYEDGYKIKSDVDKNFKLLDTNPPYILNIKENTLQEFEIDATLFERLKKAPRIESKDFAKVYNAISKKMPTIEIKIPAEIKIKIIDTKPTPQIHLKSTSFKIDFDYDGYTVKYEPVRDTFVLFDANEKVEVRRDLECEESTKKRIESFGFEIEIKDGDIFVEYKDSKKQEQLKVFKEFLNTHLQELEDEGWSVKNLKDFDMKFEKHSEVVVESDDENDWFSLSFNLEFDGKSQPIAPLVTGIIAEFDNFESMPERVNIEVEENHFVEVQTKQIAPIIKTIIELMDKKEKDDTLKLEGFDAHLLANLDDGVIWKGSKEILELSRKLKNFKGIKKVKPPKALTATLRDYQQEGLNWLGFLHEFKFAGILADDMGLGKTIQTLAHLSRLKEKNRLKKPALIVMPTSLIANWKNEIKRFTPNLSVLSLHGNDRAERFKEIKNNDILLTTYALIVRDKEKFDKFKFSYIVLDEAQKIKNPKTKMAVAIKEFKSEYRLALSGTPVENHLGELWSIFSFLMPGFLDNLSFFKSYYQNPIEKEHDFGRQELLNRRIKPFMIRRTKELVASELPSKTEIVKYTQFENKQSILYESIRVAMEEKVRQAVESKGLASSHITILDALLKLRQVCCDPSLLKLKEAQKVKESAKLELFLDLVDELLAEDRKILVFSQFTSMLSIIEEKIKLKKISYTKLTGSTIKREEAIGEFTNGKADIFLISLKAGGVGLNLTEADTVIHYDPWWNPAVENQATDRAHRIGQTKKVFVYKLIVENTIEQKILELQKKKKAIQDGIYDGDKQQDDTKFKGDDLLELLK